MAKVFLGGTASGSTWRDKITPLLEIDYFNPVVADWNEEAYKKTLYERVHCDFCLYVITPKMNDVYSIAELVDDSNKRPEKTLFCILTKDGNDEFTPQQIKSLQAVSRMVQRNGGKIFRNIKTLVSFLNAYKHI